MIIDSGPINGKVFIVPELESVAEVRSFGKTSVLGDSYWPLGDRLITGAPLDGHTRERFAIKKRSD